MQKTLNKDTARLILKSPGRFLSITAIVTIGVAFFVGVSASSPVMSASVDAYDDETGLKDITIYSDYGFDQEDVDAVSKTKGVSEASGAYFVDVNAANGTSSYVTRVHSYNADSDINRFELQEGRLPENDQEAVAEYGSELSSCFAVGDKVKLSRPDNDLSDWLDTDTVTIVGLIKTPLYLNETKENSTLSNQYLQTYLYMPESAFQTDYFLEVNVLIDGGKDMDSFSDAYESAAAAVKEDIETLAETQVNHRETIVMDKAQSKYNDGLQEYEDGLQKYEDGIREGQQKIDDAEKQIADGEQEITDGIQTLKDSQEELDAQQISGQRQINDARAEISKGEAELKDAETQFAQTSAEYNAQKEQLNQQLAQVNTGITSLTQVSDSIKQIQTLKKNVNDLSALFGLDSSTSTIQNLLDSGSAAVLSGAMKQSDFDALKTGIDGMIAQSQGTVSYSSTLAALNGFMDNSVLGILQQLNAQMGTAFASADEVDAKIAEYQASAEAIQSGIDQIDAGLADGQKQIDSAREQIKKGYQECINASVELDSQVAEAQQKINDGYAEIEDSRTEIADAKIELADAKTTFEKEKKDGWQELQDAKADLDKAAQDIADLEDGSWTVLDRTEHYASVTYSDSVDQMAAIAAIFPVFFFLVAALVCLTTMSRMIDEQRGQIGILRALGYTQMQCTGKYMIYALSATVLGGILGTVLGMLIFPPVIYNAWKMMYNLPAISHIIPWNLVIVGNLSFIAVMSITTWFACHRDMTEVPAQLLRPKAPKLGKSTVIERIPMIWNHLSFTWKVTIRNLLRYKKRFVMTVIGVAGCTALLITGFGVRDSITTIVDKQFTQIYSYDGIVKLDSDLSVSETESIAEKASEIENVSEVTLLSYYSGKAYDAKDNESTVRTEVYTNASDSAKVYQLRSMSTGKTIALDDSGIIISEKLSNKLNVSVGDTITMESKNGVRAEAKVTGICEMYLYHYVMMTETYYEELFKTSLQPNSIYITAADSSSSQQVQNDLIALDGVSGIEFYDVVLENFQTMVKSLNIIIWVLIISSLSLACVVLGNLTNVNISERQREIATLKVLGFRKKEVESYIYKENNVLTFIGSLVGIPMGTALHHYIMGQIEMDYVMFGRQVYPSSILICIVLTLVFGMAVNVFMKKKLHRIAMVESLKSVE